MLLAANAVGGQNTGMQNRSTSQDIKVANDGPFSKEKGNEEGLDPRRLEFLVDASVSGWNAGKKLQRELLMQIGRAHV